MKVASLLVVGIVAIGCYDSPAVSPVKPPPAAVVQPPRVYIGQHQVCVREATGEFRCAGGNHTHMFRLPQGPDACPGGGEGCFTQFTNVDEFRGYDRLAFGFLHACASDARGVWCWGDLEHLEGSSTCTTPISCRAQTEVKFALTDVVQLESTSEVTCALTRAGDVYCWGVNDLGLVGDGTTDGVPCSTVTDPNGVKQTEKCRLVPTRVVGIAKATQLVVGMEHACALIEDGSVKCWGANDDGQLGDGAPGAPCTSIGRAQTCRSTPVTVKLDDVKQLAAGRLNTCAVRRDGTVACWGWTGTSTQPTPQPVVGLSKIVEVASGFTLNCARSNTGMVACWGLWPTESGPYKHLDEPTVVRIAGEPVGFAAYESDFCVIVKQGPPLCWGDNDQGQLGLPATKLVAQPRPI